MGIVDIRPIARPDIVELVAAFGRVGWPGKTVALFQRYLDEQASGARSVFVADLAGGLAGYLTVRWVSDYEPFRDAGIPEIQDLNVLPHARRRGVATSLMDAAEAATAVRSDIAGIGVGLYADYAAAHLMYLRRGYLPDGRGVAYRSVTVHPGSSVRVDDDLALVMTRRLR